MAKKVRQPKEEVGTDGLTPGTRKLLNELVDDLGNPGLPPEDRIFNKESADAYIYNLLISPKYKFSIRQYKELFNYLTK